MNSETKIQDLRVEIEALENAIAESFFVQTALVLNKIVNDKTQELQKLERE